MDAAVFWVFLHATPNMLLLNALPLRKTWVCKRRDVTMLHLRLVYGAKWATLHCKRARNGMQGSLECAQNKVLMHVLQTVAEWQTANIGIDLHTRGTKNFYFWIFICNNLDKRKIYLPVPCHRFLEHLWLIWELSELEFPRHYVFQDKYRKALCNNALLLTNIAK